jgi:predicted dithiol-disulfide oxidoreductase (DUF899 family)
MPAVPVVLLSRMARCPTWPNGNRATVGRGPASTRKAQSRSMTIIIAEPGRLTRTVADIGVYQQGLPQRSITSSARLTRSKPGGQIERERWICDPDASPADRAEIPPSSSDADSSAPTDDSCGPRRSILLPIENGPPMTAFDLIDEYLKEDEIPMELPPIVSPQEWEAAHQELLVEEKELTRARDAMAAKRRRMPWMAVEKDYRFEGPMGPASLADLFEGRRQLIVYRAFYAPDVTTYPAGGGTYPERACVGCSFMADQVAHPAHLNARDTTLAFVSRAPQAEIRDLKERMGWETIPWYTLTDDFDADFGVDQWHGTNAFVREGDRIFRTYFVHDRGDEHLGSTWSYLDITALGRQEEWEDSPVGYPQLPPYQWWNYHDAYGKGA